MACTSDVIGVEFLARPSGSAAAGPWCSTKSAELAAAAVSLPPRRAGLLVRTAHSAGPASRTTHTILDVPLGDRSVVWADTYWFISDGDKLHHTGLTVYSLVSVGRAVLLAYEMHRPTGRRSPGPTASREPPRLERPVVDAMGRALEAPGGSPASARRSRTASCRP